jgi:hypothetical protein
MSTFEALSETVVHKFQLKSIDAGGLTVRVRICAVAFLPMVSSEITKDNFSLARMRYLGSAMKGKVGI